MPGCDTPPRAQGQQTTQTQTPASAGSGSGAPAAADTADLQEEVGDRDLTYLRTRAVFRYDFKSQIDDATANQFRLKLLYAFGPKQRFGLSLNIPVVWKTVGPTSAFGSGDVEIAAGGNFYRTENFRTGALAEVTLQTASENLIGGGSTKMKGAWGLTYVMSSRFEATAAFSYKQSVNVSRGGPTKQFEPDIALNARIFRSTWFVESDSFYDFIPSRFAPMIKTGLSRNFGEKKSWTATVYAEWPLNGYARNTQHIVNTGFDLTWYPFEGR